MGRLVRIGAKAFRRPRAAPEGIADRFDLSLADVHRALAYYYDHPDEMDRYERRERKREQTADDAEPFERARERLRRVQ